MSDYKEQVNSLREHADLIETSIELYGPSATRLLVYDLRNAAAAIEDLEARLGEAENSVERWKDIYLTKHEPKRGEFEKSLHEMFDSIWDCDINHPIFQDTVGELMEAVLQAYDTVNRAKMEVQE